MCAWLLLCVLCEFWDEIVFSSRFGISTYFCLCTSLNDTKSPQYIQLMGGNGPMKSYLAQKLFLIKSRSDFQIAIPSFQRHNGEMTSSMHSAYKSDSIPCFAPHFDIKKCTKMHKIVIFAYNLEFWVLGIILHFKLNQILHKGCVHMDLHAP